MELYKKNRLLFWVMIILVAINIATLTSFFIFSKQSVTPAPAFQVTSGSSCSGFCTDLDLSPEQVEKVELIDQNYKNNASVIVTKIKNKRIEILEELSKDKPDSSLTNKYADEVAILQSKLQRENIKQYLELKKVCTPEQAQLLSAIYRDLYGCPMQGKGMNRNRHGKDLQKSECR